MLPEVLCRVNASLQLPMARPTEATQRCVPTPLAIADQHALIMRRATSFDGFSSSVRTRLRHYV